MYSEQLKLYSCNFLLKEAGKLRKTNSGQIQDGSGPQIVNL